MAITHKAFNILLKFLFFKMIALLYFMNLFIPLLIFYSIQFITFAFGFQSYKGSSVKKINKKGKNNELPKKKYIKK